VRDIATLLAQKETEYQQLLRMQIELRGQLQVVEQALLRAEGALGILKTLETSEPASMATA
jgi:acetolactate synthase small subunit